MVDSSGECQDEGLDGGGLKSKAERQTRHVDFEDRETLRIDIIKALKNGGLGLINVLASGRDDWKIGGIEKSPSEL